ncbi:MAG TPA: flagellar basal-body rod protein FlgG [Gemmatimonadaceae bacterium]|nr:flagellar basal-body rod protein FlgG [Gemmatimonadaceae bacterium]
MHIAATGMQAQQQSVDTIANNLANVNTVGFKKSRVTFADLVSQQAALAGADGPPLAAPVQVGAGVGISSVAKLFDAGDMKQTGSAFDIAIQGDGFLEVELADGTRGYSRGGTLKVNADGVLVDAAGNALRPGITVPNDATALVIERDGRVRISVADQAPPIEAGQLELVRFPNPGGLVATGTGVYRASDASGEAISGRAGADGIGTVTQGFLEGSNVRMVDEMVSLMVAQRAYEANVKVIQASDEMLGMINALRK